MLSSTRSTNCFQHRYARRCTEVSILCCLTWLGIHNVYMSASAAALDRTSSLAIDVQVTIQQEAICLP